MSTRTDASRTPAVEPVAAASGQGSLTPSGDTLVLADGSRLRLRPLGCADRDRLAALFARLSPESRYRRFLSPKPALTARELVYLTDIDRFRHEAVAAVDPRDGFDRRRGPVRPICRSAECRRGQLRGRRRAAGHGHRHRARDAHRAARPRPRRRPPHRIDAVGQPSLRAPSCEVLGSALAPVRAASSSWKLELD